MPRTPRSLTSASTAPQRRWAAAWLLVLAAGWLMAQGVGLLHRTVHGGVALPSSSHALSHAPAAECEHGAVHQAGPTTAWPAFDGHEDGSAECRLVDQLSHADALLGAGWLPAVGAPLPEHHCWVPAALSWRHVQAFEARGPPRG